MYYKISVIVPVYNTEKYLHRCINSLVNQTLKDIEIILVNDASTDRSLEILRDYEQKYDNVIVIDSIENKRQGGARNLGIEISKGEYLAFVDSDDWICETTYEKLYTKALRDKADVVDCDYYTAKENSIVKKYISNNISDIGEMNINKYKRIILNDGRIVTKIIKRTIFIDNNIRYPEHLLYEDNSIGALILMYAKQISKVSEYLYYYRVDNISTTRSFNNFNYFDRLETSRIFLSLFKTHGFYEIYKEEVNFRFTQFFLINTIRRCVKHYSPPLPGKIKEISDEILSLDFDYTKNLYYRKMKCSRRFRTWRLTNYPFLSCKTSTFLKKK